MPKSPKSPKRKTIRTSKHKVWSTNIEKDTIENKNWRKVIYTSKHLQVTLMTVPPKEDLFWEVHDDTDQFFRIEKGKGMLLTKPTKTSKNITKKMLYDGVSAVVPENVWHNVVNTSTKEPLKLYSIYSPPHHPPKIIDKTHKHEIIRESHEH